MSLPTFSTPRIPRENFPYKKVLPTIAFALFVIPLICLIVGMILTGIASLPMLWPETELHYSIEALGKIIRIPAALLVMFGTTAFFAWIAIFPAAEIVRLFTRLGLAGLVPSFCVSLALIASISATLLYITKGREDISAMMWNTADTEVFFVVVTFGALNALIVWITLRVRLPHLFVPLRS